MIIHIRDIERALDELIRIVAPGGRLALYVTNASAWDHKLEAVARFLIRKPLKGLERLPMGQGIWYDWHGERLWVWRIDVQAFTQYVEARGMKRIARVGGEFSEIQQRVRGPLQRLLLHGNNLAYRLGMPPGPASTNLFVFEKNALTSACSSTGWSAASPRVYARFRCRCDSRGKIVVITQETALVRTSGPAATDLSLLPNLGPIMVSFDEIIDRLRVPPDKSIRLKDYDPGWAGDPELPKEERKRFAEEMRSLRT